MDPKQETRRIETRFAGLRYPEPAMLSFLENEVEPVAARVETINRNVVWLEMSTPVQSRSLVKIELSHYLLLGEVLSCRKYTGPYCVAVQLRHSVNTGEAAKAGGLRSGLGLSRAAGACSTGYATA